MFFKKENSKQNSLYFDLVHHKMGYLFAKNFFYLSYHENGNLVGKIAFMLCIFTDGMSKTSFVGAVV